MVDKILTGFFFIASIFLLVSHADAAGVQAAPAAEEVAIIQYQNQVK